MHTDRRQFESLKRIAFRWLPGLLGAALLLGALCVPAFFLSGYAVAGCLLLLAASAFDFYRNRHAGLARTAIDEQLQDVAQAGKVNDVTLKSVPVSDAATIGWNRLAEDSLQRRALEHLEQNINERLGSSGAAHEEGILESLGEGVGVTDLEGRLVTINRALAAALATGDDAEEIQGRVLTDLLLEAAGDCDTIRKSAGHSRPVSVDFTQNRDGVSHHLRCSRRPRFNDESEVVGHVWTLRDVTQQKLAEDSREQFVSTASHELRTPLANIRAYAETLALNDNIDFERQKGFLNTIHTEANRLSRFVDDLLDITRMQCGNVTLDTHETDLQRLVQEVIGKVAPEMERKKLIFESEIPPKLPKIAADKDKLAAALVNLLGNAAKYTPDEGEVTFRVESDGSRILFAVEDTGIGIAQDEQPRVFERFFRSDDDQVREITGSGLGLAFTQEVARLHGGNVEVRSELGKGSVFTMSIPTTKSTGS